MFLREPQLPKNNRKNNPDPGLAPLSLDVRDLATHPKAGWSTLGGCDRSPWRSQIGHIGTWTALGVKISCGLTYPNEKKQDPTT